ncbi:Protein HESO1 [Vitis vinifera]|uniref:Protein HESO1 n=1 Tax=Vitis vinifera TaxID=29760 RepID=A0A438ENF0_VITVI|nr:Protein HESO1 [Vitis vinifera]
MMQLFCQVMFLSTVFLQTCRPAILPPLKEIYSGNVADDLIGIYCKGQIEETSTANINRFKRDRSRVPNRSSLSELFISFLAKFADITSRASEQGICPYTGQWVDIDSNMRWMPRTYELFVEDPFEQPENTARGVRSRQLQRISEAFQTTHQRLTSANQDQNSLLDTLVRPQIAQFIRRAPSRNSSAYGRNNSRTYPSVPNVANSPLQFQNDFQNRRPQSRPNTTSQSSAPVQAHPNSVTMQRSMYTRPGSSTVQRSVQQATQSQSQRVWRPRSDR